MTWGLVAVAGTSLVSGLIASNASSNASNTQAAAADRAAELQKQEFDQSRSDSLAAYNTSRNDLAPYRNVGTNALLALSDTLGIARPQGYETTNTGNPQFREDPGYKFAFDQGLKGVDARFRGMSRSGAKMQALTNYGQGVADQQYGNWLGRLSGLASTGQTATGQSASLSTGLTNNLDNLNTNYANNTGNLLQNSAAARASGYVGSSNAATGAINNLANYAGYTNLFGNTGTSYAGNGNGEW